MWKDIPGWEDRYQANSDGRIRSKDMLVKAGKSPYGKAVRKGRELKPVVKGGRYLAVTLAKGPNRKQYLIHDLIMLTFKGPKPKGLQTCHNNDVKKDNSYSNLRYDTAQGNNADRYRTDSIAFGERHGMSVLTEGDVKVIRKSKENRSVLAKHYGVTPEHIWAIRMRRVWKRVD